MDMLAPALASALLHSLWQDALLAAAAALTLRAMAPASAASRHAVAMAFLVAMALAPGLQCLALLQGPPNGEALLPALAALPPGPANVFVQGAAPVAAFVVLAWLLGVGFMLARHVAGLRAIAALERAPHRPLPPVWQARAETLRAAMGIVRDVAIRLSDEVVTPCTARLLRPVVWLPLSLLTRASPAHIEALLAHELAHIARKDWLWNGLQCAIEALLFFHPAVWWLGRRVRQEREHAADDLAVAACGDPLALAEALAALERTRRAAPRPLPGLALAAAGGPLLQRIRRLLTAPPSRGRWGPASAAVALVGALAISGLLVFGQAPGGPDLEVEASTAGPLRPGDYSQVSANADGRKRVYRISLDTQGRATETYREGGQLRPIDTRVRAWLAEVKLQEVRAQTEAARAQAEANRAQAEAARAQHNVFGR